MQEAAVHVAEEKLLLGWTPSFWKQSWGPRSRLPVLTWTRLISSFGPCKVSWVKTVGWSISFSGLITSRVLIGDSFPSAELGHVQTWALELEFPGSNLGVASW
jgi:hypothetical protein